MSTIATSKDALAQAKTRMEKAVEDFRKELGSVRTGRANVSLLDHIRVDYHGTPMPINQLGTLNVPDAVTIVISPWDPGAVPLIDKAIRTYRSGFESDERRESGARADSAADRRPAQGSGEAHSQGAGKSSHGGAKYSPRNQGSAWRSWRRKRKSARTTRSVRWMSSKS